MKSREASEPKIVAKLHGINVFSAPLLSRAHIRNINTNNFERPEIEAGLANLRPGDRIVEMGAGSGIVGSIFTINIDDLRIYSLKRILILFHILPSIMRATALQTSSLFRTELW